ncbi:hypothetical protein T08_4347 [Trichinella sp. T8]|nr:hypothetical protein T08_4347 [Trichinella sp. T8]
MSTMSGCSYCPSCSFLNGALSYPVPQPNGACAPVLRRQFTKLRQYFTTSVSAHTIYRRVLRLKQLTRLVAL